MIRSRIGQFCVAVPDSRRLGAGRALPGERDIVLAVGAGKDDDRGLHLLLAMVGRRFRGSHTQPGIALQAGAPAQETAQLASRFGLLRLVIGRVVTGRLRPDRRR